MLTDIEWVKSIRTQLADSAYLRCEKEFKWLSTMPQVRRALIRNLANEGVRVFITGLEHESQREKLAREIFNVAPRELQQSVSLIEAFQLVRVMVGTVAETVESRSPALREAALQFSRDVAFAAAEVYAETAETRGLWDTRLEALIVDSIVTGTGEDELLSRTAALGWQGFGAVKVVVGTLGENSDLEAIRRTARKQDCDVLIGVQGERLMLVFGQLHQGLPSETQRLFSVLCKKIKRHFAPGPIVCGPTVRSISKAHYSASAVLQAIAVPSEIHNLEYPVKASELLPERAILGDTTAQQELVSKLYDPLSKASSGLLLTLRTYLLGGCSLEHTSRELDVHTNTVRYRLKRIAELTGWNPTSARGAFALHIALLFGDLSNQPQHALHAADSITHLRD